VVAEKVGGETAYWAFGDNRDIFKPVFVGPSLGPRQRWCLYVEEVGAQTRAVVVVVDDEYCWDTYEAYYVPAANVEVRLGEIRGRGAAFTRSYRLEKGALVSFERDRGTHNGKPEEREFSFVLSRNNRQGASAEWLEEAAARCAAIISKVLGRPLTAPAIRKHFGDDPLLIDVECASKAPCVRLIRERGNQLWVDGVAFLPLRYLAPVENQELDHVLEWQWDEAFFKGLPEYSVSPDEAVIKLEAALQSPMFYYDRGILTAVRRHRWNSDSVEDFKKRSFYSHWVLLEQVYQNLGFDQKGRDRDGIISEDDRSFLRTIPWHVPKPPAKGGESPSGFVAWIESGNGYTPRVVGVTLYIASGSSFFADAGGRFVHLANGKLWRGLFADSQLSGPMFEDPRDEWFDRQRDRFAGTVTLKQLVKWFEANTGKKLHRPDRQLAKLAGRELHLQTESKWNMTVADAGYGIVEAAEQLRPPNGRKTWILFETPDSWCLDSVRLPDNVKRSNQ